MTVSCRKTVNNIQKYTRRKKIMANNNGDDSKVETLDVKVKGAVEKAASPKCDSDFVVAPTDKQGHGGAMHCRIGYNWTRMVEVIIAGKEFPFATSSDFYRFAVAHTLGYLHSIRDLPRSKGMLAQLRVINEVLADELIGHQLSDTLEKVGDAVNKHLKTGNKRAAKRLVRTIWSSIEEMPDEEKEQHQIALRRQFGHLLPGKPVSAVDLVDDEDDEEEPNP